MNTQDEAMALILTLNRAMHGLLEEAARYLPQGDGHPAAADLRSRIDFVLWLQPPITPTIPRLPVAEDALSRMGLRAERGK